MDYRIITAIITAGAAVTVAVASFFLNESAKRKAEWQQKKFEHYKKLLSALSELAVDGRNKPRANEEFSTVVNTIGLIASQKVINCLMLLHDEIKFSNKDNFSPERHDKLLQNLILAIRKDIGLSKKDKAKTFNFHLIGSKPQ